MIAAYCSHTRFWFCSELPRGTELLVVATSGGRCNEKRVALPLVPFTAKYGDSLLEIVNMSTPCKTVRLLLELSDREGRVTKRLGIQSTAFWTSAGEKATA